MQALARILALQGALVLCRAQESTPTLDGYGVWHAVDVQELVCPLRTGSQSIVIPLSVTDPTVTHVLTFFRTAKQSVVVDFVLTDAMGTAIASEGVTLQSHTARRLGDALPSGSVPPIMAEEEDEPHGHIPGGAEGRLARASRRRRRAAAVVPSPTVSSRRRSSSASPSKPLPAGAQPFSTGTAWANTQTGRPNYGYASPAQASQNYGGQPPYQTGYGYSGSSALGSGTKVALALGGGVLAGALGSHIIRQLFLSDESVQSALDLNCTHDGPDDTWQGVCRNCVRLYTEAGCTVQLPADADLVRDDVMATGFVPADFASPLTLNITRLWGVDLSPSAVCPPEGWNESSNEPPWAMPDAVVLAAVTEIGDAGPPGGGTSGSHLARGVLHRSLLMLGLGASFCHGLL